MTNILKFPTQQELPDDEHELSNDEMFIEELGDDIAEKMMNYLIHHNFETSNENFLDDFTFAIEAFKSAMYRTMDMEHVLHPYIDELMEQAHEDYENNT